MQSQTTKPEAIEIKRCRIEISCERPLPIMSENSAAVESSADSERHAADFFADQRAPPYALIAVHAGAHGIEIVALVASRLVESFRKNRTLYVPGVIGIVNGTVAPATPVAGLVRDPFR